MTTTLVKNLPWCLRLDRKTCEHAYVRNVDLAFEGNSITYLGPAYAGPADHTLDGRCLFAIPGLIDVHSHPSTEPGYKGVREDHGSSYQYSTGLYERVVAFKLSPEGRRAAAEAAYSELLLSGVTTLVELSNSYPNWIENIARSGLRGYLAPGFASSQWHLPNAWTLAYQQSADDGRAQLAAALELIEKAECHPSGRLRGMLYPAQIDTCSPELFKATLEIADRRQLLVTTHVAQSILEFNEIVRRSGQTPLQYAQGLGLLEPNCILGHAIFHSRHSAIGWAGIDDFELLSRSGAAVAHCPLPFARYGQMLESLGRYLKSGITVALGTDVAPHDLLEEMRLAAVLSRVADRSLWGVGTGQIFDAATIQGAKALHRDDIGGLAVGMKADIVLIDLDEPRMRPVRDPVRSLIHSAGGRAVKHVFIDGTQVVENRRVLTLDPDGALEVLENEQQRMLEGAAKFDFDRRHGDTIAPLTFAMQPG